MQSIKKQIFILLCFCFIGNFVQGQILQTFEADDSLSYNNQAVQFSIYNSFKLFSSNGDMMNLYDINGVGISANPKVVFYDGNYNRLGHLGFSNSNIQMQLRYKDGTGLRIGSISLIDMFFDGTGKVGIGTLTPSESLEVAGLIYSNSGGFKFPDGTIQITAATGGDNLGDHSASQALNMNSNPISNLNDPSNPQDAATKNYVDAYFDGDSSSTNELITGAILNGNDLEITDSGGTFSVDLSSIAGQDNLGNHIASQNLNMAIRKIINLGPPSNHNDAATKIYVDTHTDGDSSISNELQVLNLIGNTLSISNGNSIDLSSLSGGSDNLGNHIATENIQLNGNYLSNDGDNEGVFVSTTGTVSIGTNTIATGYILNIDGKSIVEELKVQDSGSWPDYVFEESYDLLPLEEVAASIMKNKHLPGIPSAAEITKAEGFHIGEMQKLTLEKVEELTLYAIEADRQISELKEKNENLEKSLNDVQNQMKLMMERIKELEK